jgi:hypothetical protein
MKYIADKLIWQPNAYNVRRQGTSYLRGTNLVTQQYYDGYGFQTDDFTSATGIGTYAYNSYDFDEIKGNLLLFLLCKFFFDRSKFYLNDFNPKFLSFRIG